MPKYKKGETGNPNGAPEKEWTWGSLFKEMMEEYKDDPKLGKKAIAKAMVKKAQGGDTQAFREMANRMDGMPKQAVDHTTKGDKIQPVLVKFIDGEDNNDTDGV